MCRVPIPNKFNQVRVIFLPPLCRCLAVCLILKKKKRTKMPSVRRSGCHGTLMEHDGDHSVLSNPIKLGRTSGCFYRHQLVTDSQGSTLFHKVMQYHVLEYQSIIDTASLPPSESCYHRAPAGVPHVIGPHHPNHFICAFNL